MVVHYVIASHVQLYGHINVSHNTAVQAGGGFYLFLSELVCNKDCVLSVEGNTAMTGGGAHVITSILTVVYGSRMNFVQNMADTNGGGVYLEVNAKINIMTTIEKLPVADTKLQ